VLVAQTPPKESGERRAEVLDESLQDRVWRSGHL
jgi:hypothetical protein